MSMEYKVVSDNDIRVLSKEVNHSLDCGWKVAGGLAVSPSGLYVQAMVRVKKESHYEDEW